LLLERANRQVKGKVFLDKCFTEYCKLYENSGLLKKQIKDSLTPLAPELIGKPLKKPLELTYTPSHTPTTELALEPVKKNVLKNLNFLAPIKKHQEHFKEDAQDKITNKFYKLESGIPDDDNLEHLEEVTKNISEEENTHAKNALKKKIQTNLDKTNNKTTTEIVNSINDNITNEINSIINDITDTINKSEE
jgi:hypothetical protein